MSICFICIYSFLNKIRLEMLDQNELFTEPFDNLHK